MDKLRGEIKKQSHDYSICNQQFIPNLLENSWWEKDLVNWTINSGQVTLEEDDAGFLNLTADSEISSQVKQRLSLRPRHMYFLMFDVKVTRYHKGLFGVYFNGKFKNSVSDIGLRRKSKNGEYETIISTLEASEDWMQPRSIFVGSIGSASGAGRIRRLSLYDLTEVFGNGNEPSAVEFYKILPKLQDAKGVTLNSKEVFSALLPQRRLREGIVVYQKKDAIKLFIDEMNKKAKLLGMKKTTFKNVNGFRAAGQVTTAKDLLKLGLYATGFNELLQVWGKKEHEVTILGEHSRKLIIETTVKNSDLEEKCILLGGKTGTIGSEIFNVLTLITDYDNDIYLAVALGAMGDQHRFSAIKELFDIACSVEKHNKISSFELENVKSRGIIKIPKGNPFFYVNQSIPMIYGMNEDKKVEIASLVKIMTAILLLENNKNLYQYVTLESSDILGGSGPKLLPGDKISLLDLLHLAMLPSSNTAAKVIARVVGKQLLLDEESVFN